MQQYENRWETIDDEDWQSLLDVFMPSAQMREYLKTQKLPKFRAIELICGSPVSIGEKLRWLEKLAEKEAAPVKKIEVVSEELELPNFGGSFSLCSELYRNAVRELKLQPGELFLLRDKYYDDETFDDEERDCNPFLSLKKVMEYIRSDPYDYGSHRDENEPPPTCWYELEKWCPDDSGNLILRYTYYFIGKQIAYFHETDSDDFDLTCYSAMSVNLPVPVQPGDLVTIDCTPYRPAKLGIILETGDNHDCCSLQALTGREDGGWCSGAVKHASLFAEQVWHLSPLYRLETVENTDMPAHELLLAARNYIDGDNDKGEKLHDYLYCNCRTDDFTDEELIRALDAVREGDG